MQPEEKQLLFEEANHFLTSKGERLLIAHRRHIVTLIPPILFIGVFYLLAVFLSIGFMLYASDYVIESVLFLLTSTALCFLFLAKTVISWQFHLYIITTKKILEAAYVPLSEYYINDILLDQVKCTEVDIHTHGILHELFDMGDIGITFDRPTHQEEFTMHDIPYVRETASFLTAELLGKRIEGSSTRTKIQTRWLKEEDNPEKYIYTEDTLLRNGR